MTSERVQDLTRPEAIRALQTMLSGYRTSQMIFVVAKLGIADLLKEGPKGVEELAQATSTHVPSLYRVLRALAGLGIFTEIGEHRFGLSPLAEPLQSDVPGSLRSLAAFFGSSEDWQAWGHLSHSVMSGEPASDHVLGMPRFEYLEKHPELAAVFDKHMAEVSVAHANAVVESYDFSGIGTLVDVGGGHGTLLATILKRYPSVRGVLFEMPHVAAGAGPVLDAAGVRDRVTVQSGDFFAQLPDGGDAYIMKWILHDWDDARAAQILRNCRAVMPPGGRVIVVDAVIDDSPKSLPGKLLDIQMLIMTPGGRERTEAEFRQLFAESGFRLERILDTGSPLKVIEARPV